MMKFATRVLIGLILMASIVHTQNISIEKIEPPNWWKGMQWNKVQLMIYGENLFDVSVSFNNPEIKISKIHQVENHDYLFVDIEIPVSIDAGTYELILSNNLNEIKHSFQILERESDNGRYQGFDAGDVIYLITPDRFVNGDKSNDEVEGLIPDFEPENPLGRHGGDIQGIINKLDYLYELGITAIWINPLVENNNDISYHGYAATDLYNIDPRFGTNELYKELVNEAHKKGLKIIYDHVSNHISINHPWMKNLPVPDWINGTIENHIDAIHHKMALTDLYADSSTINNLTNGWFVDSMPDLNQRNSFVKNYIIQNTLWWIEFTGLDGIREDTYPYVDQKFLSEWAEVILNEYSDLNIVGEVWTGETAFLASYQSGSYLPRKYDTNLPSVTDFGMRDVYYSYLKGENGLYKVYETLAKDYLYPNPKGLVVFIDNHDVTRAMLAADGDMNKVKIALTLLLTTRGIPQILYGTEIGMEGGEDHGLLRADFPGGFENDERNAFIEEGRSEKENEIFNYLKNLLLLRKNYKALSEGRLIHFPPVGEIYFYLKKHHDQTILIIVNGSGENKTLNMSLFSEHLGGIEKFKCLMTGKTIEISELLLPANQVKIMEIVNLP